MMADEHPCADCRHARLSKMGGNWCVERRIIPRERCDEFAPFPDYSICQGCLYARWHGRLRFCDFDAEPEGGACALRDEPRPDAEPCDGCRHLLVTRKGARLCTLTRNQRYDPTRCKHFEVLPDYALCRGCVHAAWREAGRRCCTLHLPAPQGGECAGFEREEFPAPRCPACREVLTKSDGHVECPNGHRYALRKQGGSVCPSCGRPYATFGLTHGDQRQVVYLCADCGWTDERWTYAGPPRGRSRYGGQRWSPATGRLLARR